MGKTPLLFPRELLGEDLKDFRYATHQSILLPSSKIFIGSQGKLTDAELYEALDVTFSFANGTGDNGLDAGVEAQDQWYALYAVPNAANTAYILKASIQPPHAAGGTGPSGYTKYRYLGVFRNGGNGYDATNSSYGRGDIAWFKKFGKRMEFVHFNSNGGGSYPAAVLVQGLNIYVANTSVNTTVITISNALNWGFGAFNAAGGIKLPYHPSTGALYRFAMGVNTSTQGAMIARDDAGVNDRQYTTLAFNGSQVGGEAWVVFTPENASGVGSIFTSIPGNPNISRVANCRAMIDPFIII